MLYQRDSFWRNQIQAIERKKNEVRFGETTRCTSCMLEASLRVHINHPLKDGHVPRKRTDGITLFVDEVEIMENCDYDKAKL